MKMCRLCALFENPSVMDECLMSAPKKLRLFALPTRGHIAKELEQDYLVNLCIELRCSWDSREQA